MCWDCSTQLHEAVPFGGVLRPWLRDGFWRCKLAAMVGTRTLCHSWLTPTDHPTLHYNLWANLEYNIASWKLLLLDTFLLLFSGSKERILHFSFLGFVWRLSGGRRQSCLRAFNRRIPQNTAITDMVFFITFTFLILQLRYLQLIFIFWDYQHLTSVWSVKTSGDLNFPFCGFT